MLEKKKRGRKKNSSSFGIQSQLDLEEKEEPQDKINCIQGCNCSTLLDNKGWESTLEHREKPGYVQNIYLCVCGLWPCVCVCACVHACLCVSLCSQRGQSSTLGVFLYHSPPYFTNQSLYLYLESNP